MIELLPEQVEAVRQLKQACQDAGVDAVIIGATAYRVWIDDDRRTQDVDVALAVDIDQFGSVTEGSPPHIFVAASDSRGVLHHTSAECAVKGAVLQWVQVQPWNWFAPSTTNPDLGFHERRIEAFLPHTNLRSPYLSCVPTTSYDLSTAWSPAAEGSSMSTSPLLVIPINCPSWGRSIRL
jgi:hypothetical protein